MSIRTRNKPNAEFSFASIADIVFLLLIYFMLTSSFVQQSALKIELPTSNSEKPGKGGNYVSVTNDGQYAWNNKVLDDREELWDLIGESLEASLQDEDPSNDVITLRVDKRAEFDGAAFVMAIVAENQGKIVILTEKN
ncbi:biopolymer transporter ExbD [Pontibacter sp. G13]|uniref:ExbD/TolR family protein n=1 Tax=Pontibacter sp. G13 TaxID=3074898 RepID=UPI00288B8353|nr:biopolymer transporter ExbD [Pontibacter sp. G13]WNJ17683.1 biopolymer transporter ExbD [Pontibacter sp. G13]